MEKEKKFELMDHEVIRIVNRIGDAQRIKILTDEIQHLTDTVSEWGSSENAWDVVEGVRTTAGQTKGKL